MMVPMRNAWIGAVLLGCAACGGSGVDADKRVTALSDSEISDLCDYLADLAGPERTIVCDNGVPLHVGGRAAESACVSSAASLDSDYPGCTTTVEQMETCAKARADLSDAQLCDFDLVVPECAPLHTPECGG
jgi:hypothetical protein